jgi:PAS domain S-box-containing protein
VVSGTIDEEVAAALMKAGAHDYLMKGNLTRLAPAVKREIQDAQVRRERRKAEQALRSALSAAEERERLLHAVIQAQTDGVFVCDAGGAIIRTNPAARAFFGFDPTGLPVQEAMGKFLAADDLSSCAPCRALQGETIVGWEHVSGGHTIETSAAPIRDREGEIAGAVTICRDITERKQDENALRESEETLRQLCNSAMDAIVMIDEQGRTILSNPAAEQMFGYAPGEMLGRPIHSLVVPPAMQPAAQAGIADFMKGGKGPNIGKVLEVAAHRKDGSEFPAALSLGAIQQSHGWKAVGIVRDMTAAQEANKQIEEAIDRYNSIAEQNRTVIWEVDATGLYTYLNPASELVWGYRPEDLVGKKRVYDIIPEEEIEAQRAKITAIVARKGRFEDLERPVRTKDGRMVWICSNGMPILGKNGELVGYRGAAVDITGRKRAEEDGRLLEQRYRSLFRYMINGFTYCQMIYDEQNNPVDFITLEVNESFERLTGLHGVVGKRVSEVVPGIRQAMPEFFEVQGRVASTGEAETFEVDFKAIGRWLSVSVYTTEKGYFAAIFEDITERKRNEADRDATMALLRLLNSPSDSRELIRGTTDLLQGWSGCEAVGVRLQDGDDFPYQETRGFPAEFVEGENYLCSRQPDGEPVRDAQGNPALACICGDVLAERFDPQSSCFTKGGAFWTNNLTEHPARTGDAGAQGRRDRCHRQGYESLALVPLRSSGRTFGLLQFNDRRPNRFTPELVAQMERAAASLAIALEQRRTQQALRDSEERYRLISENTADVIWLLDLDADRYTYVSPSVRHILGYSPEEILNHGVACTLTDESLGMAMATLAEARAALNSGQVIAKQVVQADQVHKNGSVIRTEVSLTMLPKCEGRGIQVLGVTRDITPRVESEARLMQAQKLESVGRLAGGVAHDFNNLLTVINGYSSIVLRKLSPGDPLHDAVSEIAVAGKRAAALTSQLLLLSRKQVVETRAVNLNDIIVEVEKMLGRVIGEHIRLQSALAPDLGSVLADPGQMHQVLMNLAVNARDAMRNGGTLTLETVNLRGNSGGTEPDPGKKPGRYVRLKVTDTGVGMTREVQSHLFEPFFTTKKEGEGTGLGLATVYGIVKQSGGTIVVTSELGQGTTFQIDLPQIESAGMLVDEPGRDDSPARGTETILVVEDQDQLRRMVGRVLRGHGYTVHEAANPGEALLYVERYAGAIHLLLTDVVMPGMSGAELAGRLRLLRPDMAIIFMSGYSEQAMLNRQELDGAYLAKPFSPAELALRVREVLGGTPRARGAILVADDEPAVRGLLRSILTGAGYLVLEARNGKEAVQKIESGEIDLLITDLVMPEQEGLETILLLRRVRPNLKIIAMSGQFTGPLLDASKRFGAHGSLAKPIQPDVLLEAVARAFAG